MLSSRNFDPERLAESAGAGVRQFRSRCRDAVANAQQKAPCGKRVGATVAVTGTLVVLGVIAYAVWQTFRADELWIAEDDASVTP